MLVNKKINDVLNEISAKSIEYSNTRDEQRKYLKKVVNIFVNTLTYDEQVFFFKYMLDNIHYKNILIDPETMLVINNIRLRTIFLVFILTTALGIGVLATFGKVTAINDLIDVFARLVGFLTI